MQRKITIGIIGAGRIGRIHAEHLTHDVPESRVKSISDIDLEAAQKCASDLGVTNACEDYRIILEDREIDAVVISSSSETHALILEAAAEAGKHIFCEKPIAHDLEVIERALKTAERNRIKLMVGFNRRFDPNFRRIHEYIKEGRIGDPQILRITSRDPYPPPIEYVKASGGIFMDMMIHDFDMARFQSGAEVDEIYTLASVRNEELRAAGDLDTALVMLRFTNGAVGTIDNCRQAVYGYDQRIEVFGTKGMAYSDNNTPTRTHLYTSEKVQEDLPLPYFMERYMESYRNEIRHFVDCLVADKQPSVTGMDGYLPVVMGKAARLSHDQQRPVKLSEIAQTAKSSSDLSEKIS